MCNLKVTVIIPTRDRSKDLAELLSSILEQDHLPFDVIVVDDSPTNSSKKTFSLFYPRFKTAGCKLKDIKGNYDGLTAARNLGVKNAEGDIILFLDDDTLLPDQNTIEVLATFLKDNKVALGVQFKIVPLTENLKKNKLTRKLENAIYKVFMLSYSDDENKFEVRRSGASVFSNNITKVIPVQRLSGCCCYKREVFERSYFDTKLKRWGYLEDLDFSYRIYKKNPNSLYALPHIKIIHKVSEEGRLPTKTSIYMTTIYWFYIFFKDFFEGSIFNLIAFLWAIIGKLVTTIGGLIVKRKRKGEWWSFIFLFHSYLMAFKNLNNILIGNLEFFNKTLDK